MDREAWQAAFHGVIKSRTWLTKHARYQMKRQGEMHQGSHVPRPSLIPVLFTTFPHQKERHWCLCPCPWSGWSCPSCVSRCWSEKTVFSKKRHEQATSRAKSKVKWNKIGLYLFGDKTLPAAFWEQSTSNLSLQHFRWTLCCMWGFPQENEGLLLPYICMTERGSPKR